MRQSGPPKDIKEKVLKVFDRSEGERTITEVRIVCWIIDGKTGAPGLEKREKFRTEDGEKAGKVKAFSLVDLKLIMNNWDEIQVIMMGRPAELRARAPISNPTTELPF